MAVYAALPRATASGRTKRLASLVICISRFEAVPQALLPFKTRPTWAYPAHYTPALASSVISMLPPLPRLAVGAATNSVARNNSVSMFCIRYRMDLGLLCTPAVHRSAWGYVRRPQPDCVPFGSSLNQPRMACSLVTMLASVQSFDPVLQF